MKTRISLKHFVNDCCFRYLSTINICSHITVSLFFNTITTFIPNILFFQQIIVFNQKAHPLSFTIIILFKSTCPWKHNAQGFSFIIIIFVPNKMLINVLPEETILIPWMFSIFTTSDKIRFLRQPHLHFSVYILSKAIFYLLSFYIWQKYFSIL